MPRRINPQQRLQRFYSAVLTIGHYRAKKAVQAQIKARGQRISDYSCRDIGLLAQAYLGQHFNELINKTSSDLATWPEFAGCAELLTDAQTQSGA